MGNDYKNTLLMMNTEFSMKANLPLREPEILKKWEEEHLYEKVLEKNKDGKPFILHDGPPYANGNVHTGHAFNKSLKDFVLRYKTMMGYYTPYIPGWDTHGLPIETALTKNGKVNRKTTPVAEFRELCYEYALKQVANQKEQFKRLGVLGDWDNPYITLTKDFEARQIEVFAKMAEKGLIYKGLKPVYWSPSSESALAEAEVEYHDVTSDTIYLAFKIVDGKNVLDNDAELVIWTTTPWTIPGNLAVCINGDFEYAEILVKSEGVANGRKLVFAKEMLETVTPLLKITDYEIVKTIKGYDMEYITYVNPMNKICPVTLGSHVTLDAGTGLVHTAPGFGEDDFNVGKKYGLEILAPVDSRGYTTAEYGEFGGLFYEECNKLVIEKMIERNILIAQSKITHSYPHDWRTKKPIIFRATPQWFASIDGIKEDILKAIDEVNWKPAWGGLRLSNMIKDRNEWCISRQRAWGVPIPVFYCEDETPILDQEVLKHVSKLFGEYGSNIWFLKEAKDLLPEGYTNPHSPNGKFTKEKDIMDVWFDSGSSYYAVLPPRGLPVQADLYLEGSDQYRGWFNSSISTSVAVTKHAPYKTCLSHGFILDGNGNKMSKSLGNTIDPLDICKEFGADILRLWVASTEYTADVRISKDIIKQNAEAYRKIRNTFRFLLGNLSDFNPDKDKINYEELGEVDQYIECRLNNVIEKVLDAYENYDFDEVYRSILNYMTNDLSAFYMDFTKDVLYIEEMNNKERRSIQTVLFDNLDALLRLITPILPFTSEEIYSNMNLENKEISSYMLSMPKVVKYANSEELLNKYSKFMEFRTDVLKAIENARNNKVIGKSMSAKLSICPSKETKELLDTLKIDLAKVFIVSECVLVDSANNDFEEFDSGKFLVEARVGHICDRCWKVVDEVDENGLCPRCAEIIKNMEK